MAGRVPGFPGSPLPCRTAMGELCLLCLLFKALEGHILSWAFVVLRDTNSRVARATHDYCHHHHQTSHYTWPQNSPQHHPHHQSHPQPFSPCSAFFLGSICKCNSRLQPQSPDLQSPSLLSWRSPCNRPWQRQGPRNRVVTQDKGRGLRA